MHAAGGVRAGPLVCRTSVTESPRRRGRSEGTRWSSSMGTRGIGLPPPSVLWYDTDTNRWDGWAPLPHALCRLGAAVVEDALTAEASRKGPVRHAGRGSLRRGAAKSAGSPVARFRVRRLSPPRVRDMTPGPARRTCCTRWRRVESERRASDLPVHAPAAVWFARFRECARPLGTEVVSMSL